MKIAETIKSIRQKSLLSQCCFARELGVSYTTVNRWENGKSIPKISKLKQIYDFCILHNIPIEVEELVKIAEMTSARTE